jgi:Zn-dependent protease
MSLAGPAMNLLLILVISLLFKLGIIPSDQTKLSTISMAFLLQLQVCALLLNLLPIPPLDGFQAIAPWLPAEMRERMQGAANVGIFLVFIALSFIQKVFWMAVSAICNGMGVDGYWAYLGYKAFRFWAQ